MARWQVSSPRKRSRRSRTHLSNVEPIVGFHTSFGRGDPCTQYPDRAEASMSTEKIESFRVEVSDAVLDDLRARLKQTRFPDEVPDTAWEYGANLAYLKELVEYWRTKYDWRAHERAINRFAHFKANVDGLGVHFIHEQGK